MQSKQSQIIAEATIDSLPVGNDQYELEHQVQGENTTVAVWDGYTVRQAENGGWFSYRMKVLPNQDNYLAVTYFSGNNGKEIEIYVDDTLIASETLMTKQIRAFYPKRYLIPSKLTSEVHEVEIRFVMPNQMNGIFDILRMMSSYSQQAELASLSFDTGAISEPFIATQHQYTLTVKPETSSVSMNVVPAHKNALVYVNQVLIDETGPRILELTANSTQLELVVKAEDDNYTKQYSITIVKQK
ncbi:Cadherin-like beta sandwich domain protein [compost metagenome]